MGGEDRRSVYFLYTLSSSCQWARGDPSRGMPELLPPPRPNLKNPPSTAGFLNWRRRRDCCGLRPCPPLCYGLGFASLENSIMLFSSNSSRLRRLVLLLLTPRPNLKNPPSTAGFLNWRRRRDSNSRAVLPATRFPSERLRPLGHLSVLRNFTSEMRSN